MKLVQLNKVNKLSIFALDTSIEIEIPYVDSGISAGFPSPADDFLELTIDLNKELVKHPSTTFIARVKGFSMQDADLKNGDLVMIDRSLNPSNGNIAVCIINGDFTIKRLRVEKENIWLVPENKNYKPIKVTEGDDFSVWGIVTNIIKKVY